MTATGEVAREQWEFWNGAASDGWIRNQEERDASAAPLGALAMEPLELRPGDAVLDVGCGCGGTSLDLAARTGPGGKVLGIDVSAPMLARAEQRRQEAGVRHLSFVNADATTCDFPGAPFDALFSRFGVMFFADPVAAFGNLRQAMKRGGRLAFVCWRPVADNPWVGVPREVVLRHVPPPAPVAPGAPGQFAFADGERVLDILQSAGFADIGVDRHDQPFVVTPSRDPGACVEAVMNRGPASRLLADIDDATRERVRADMAPVIAPHIGEDGLVLGCSVWLVTARNQ